MDKHTENTPEIEAVERTAEATAVEVTIPPTTAVIAPATPTTEDNISTGKALLAIGHNLKLGLCRFGRGVKIAACAFGRASCKFGRGVKIAACAFGRASCKFGRGVKIASCAFGRASCKFGRFVGRVSCRFGRFLKHVPSTSNWAEFAKGIIKENPTLVGLLGMCPTLAITTMAFNGIGMGLATTFVLICSNIVISLLKRVIPKAVRLPCFIVIVASFVTFVGFILKGYIPALYDSLGLYLALITVNCIILGRAEVFASKNKLIPSLLDGLGMGLGFTAALTFIGAIREVLGSGSIFGFAIPYMTPMTIFILPAGGFFVLGCVIALVNKLAKRKPPEQLGCHGCPNSSACANCEVQITDARGKV